MREGMDQQHLVWLMQTKQWSWSLGSQWGKNWLLHALSSPELEHTRQLDMSSLKNTSQAGCLYSPSGGRWGTMSLLCTTLYIVATFSPMYWASFSFPILGLPKLCTSTGMPGNLWTNSMPLIRDRAAPRLCPVQRILDTLQNLTMAWAAASSFFSLSRQSSTKPVWMKQLGQARQGCISKLKSSIQFWALLLPRHEVTRVSVEGSQPMYDTALVTLFSMQVTFTRRGYLAVVPQLQASTQFLGQKATAAQEAYLAEITGSQPSECPMEKGETEQRQKASRSRIAGWAMGDQIIPTYYRQLGNQNKECGRSVKPGVLGLGGDALVGGAGEGPAPRPRHPLVRLVQAAVAVVLGLPMHPHCPLPLPRPVARPRLRVGLLRVRVRQGRPLGVVQDLGGVVDGLGSGDGEGVAAHDDTIIIVYYNPPYLGNNDPPGICDPGVHPGIRVGAVPAASPAHAPRLQGQDRAGCAGQQADEHTHVGAPGPVHHRRHVLRRAAADRGALQQREGGAQGQGHRPRRHWGEDELPVLPGAAHPAEQVHHLHGHLRDHRPQRLPPPALPHLREEGRLRPARQGGARQPVRAQELHRRPGVHGRGEQEVEMIDCEQPIIINNGMKNAGGVQLNNQRIRLAFQSAGYSDRDYISSFDLQRCLSTLGGQEFDVDIFEQLWEQCKLNSHGNTKVANFVDNLIRAEAILIQKEHDTTVEIKNLELKLNSHTIPSADKMELNLEYNELVELKAGFLIDLDLIRKPFANFMMDTLVPTAQPLAQPGAFAPTNMEETVYNPLQALPLPLPNRKNLAWVFYLGCIGIFGEVLVYLYLNAFMNTVLFLLVLSLFFYEHFDRRSIRFLFWFTCFTLVVDIIWFVVSAKNLWTTRQVGLWPKYLAAYLKLSVVSIACIFVMKILLAILLCSEYNIDEAQPQEIDICGKKFVLRSDNPNAPLKAALEQIGGGARRANNPEQPAPAPIDNQ